MDYFAFSGNIGAGKSASAAALSLKFGLPLVRESIDDNPFLAKFYDDPHQWAFRLQMFNIADRSRTILAAARMPGFVLDRSFEEDGIYVDVALERGYVSRPEYDVYQELHRLAMRLLPCPSLMIYLRADVSTLQQRIAARSRNQESAISPDYLEELQERYDDWFKTYPGEKISIASDSTSIEVIIDSIVASVGESQTPSR